MSDTAPIRVLGIAGSLRKASFNAMALRAAAALAPAGMVVDSFALHDIPLYNGDVEAAGFPAPVQALRAAIAGADALLIVTPEYNSSIPGVLKNALDWASRPPSQPFDGKPTAIMGASPGALGTVRAQLHLRQSLTGLNAMVLNAPQVMIGGAAQRFDAEGALTDEATRKFVAQLLEKLADWVQRLR